MGVCPFARRLSGCNLVSRPSAPLTIRQLSVASIKPIPYGFPVIAFEYKNIITLSFRFVKGFFKKNHFFTL